MSKSKVPGILAVWEREYDVIKCNDLKLIIIIK